jgi:hypothetical protein
LRGAVTLWSSARSPWRATSDLLLGCSQVVVGEIGGAPRIHARRTALRTRSRARLGSRLKKWRMRSSSRSRPEKLHPPDNPEVRCGVALASVGTAASTRSAMRRLSEARCKAAVERGCPCRHERRTQRPPLNGLAYRQTQATGACRVVASDRLEAEALSSHLGAVAADDKEQRKYFAAPLPLFAKRQAAPMPPATPLAAGRPAPPIPCGGGRMRVLSVPNHTPTP